MFAWSVERKQRVTSRLKIRGLIYVPVLRASSLFLRRGTNILNGGSKERKKVERKEDIDRKYCKYILPFCGETWRTWCDVFLIILYLPLWSCHSLVSDIFSFSWRSLTPHHNRDAGVREHQNRYWYHILEYQQRYWIIIPATHRHAVQ